jgi:hypothetical protein
VLNETIKDGVIFKMSLSFNRAHLIMAVVVAMFLICANYITKFGNMFGIVFLGWFPLSLTLIPPAILIILYEVRKTITNTK